MTEKHKIEEQTQDKKGFFDSLAEGLMTGLKDSTQALLDSANFVTELLSDGTKLLLENLTKTGEMVVDQVSGSVGYIRDGVYYVGDKAVEGTVMIKDGVVSVGEEVIGTLINTSKFITDKEYRDNVGIPWLRKVIDSNKKTLAYQMQQNQKAMDVLYRYSLGETLTGEEMEIATKQLISMAKLVPALALFLLPGGTVLLPILARMLPWELIPDLKPPSEVENTSEVSIPPQDQDVVKAT